MIYKDVFNKIRNNKIVVIGAIISALLIIMILLVLGQSNKNTQIVDEDTQSKVDNYVGIGNILTEQNKGLSEIRVVSNENNEQADIVLDTVGINLKDITSYAASIDLTQESAHAMCIVKPKKEEYESCKKELIDFVAKKQRQLVELGKTDTQEYERALSAIVSEKDGYLIMVMEKDSDSIVTNIENQIEKELANQ